MDSKTYNEEIKKLKTEFHLKLRELDIKYCLENNKVKVGDIVIDHYQTILVNEICYPYFSAYEQVPSCTYKGELLKKNLTKRKKFEETLIYQTNLKKIIKKEDQ